MSEQPSSRNSRIFSIRSDSGPAPRLLQPGRTRFQDKQDVKKNDLPRHIKVYAYSGYKANERPTAFVLDDCTYNVTHTIDRWHGVEHDYFKVLADDGKVYFIKWDRIPDLWFLVKVMEREGKH